MSGKGSARRPTDDQAFGNSYDNIFRNGAEFDEIVLGIILQSAEPDEKQDSNES